IPTGSQRRTGRRALQLTCWSIATARTAGSCSSQPAGVPQQRPRPEPRQLQRRHRFEGKARHLYPIRGFVSDVARFAIDRAVEKGWTTAKAVKSHTRLVVFDNIHDRGGQTGGGLVAFTPKSTGALMMSATVLAESFADSDAVSVLLHELGHQLGARAHYGDCTGAYLSPLVSSDSECIGDWDIMGYDSRYPQPTAYTRIDRGWLTPAATATVPLGPTGFPATVVLRSVSVDACPSSAASVWRTPYERLACLRRPIAVGAGTQRAARSSPCCHAAIPTLDEPTSGTARSPRCRAGGCRPFESGWIHPRNRAAPGRSGIRRAAVGDTLAEERLLWKRSCQRYRCSTLMLRARPAPWWPPCSGVGPALARPLSRRRRRR